ncbi:hypothetical protein [Azospirillum halopraeferens]|uniref:hypothetical protein n=1 Tax=Azospirillum halopraeferens TaxID=34010 RepID=UPI0004143EF5|nr:hypothetical protein [Azospirillum halopraeferens]
MAAFRTLADWCRHERMQQQARLEWLESGRMQVGTRDAAGQTVDMTLQSIAEARRKITELDELLARDGEA